LPLTNAQKQARWRARRNKLAQQAIVAADTDKEVVAKLVKAVGIRRALAIGRSMTGLVRETMRAGLRRDRPKRLPKGAA
jgi:hypothetical protein